jgi:tetratricopeptide (TPR) repeat protein
MKRTFFISFVCFILLAGLVTSSFSYEKKYASSYIGTGILNFEKGNYIEAILNFRSAEQLIPNPIEVYKYLGLSYANMSLWTQASQVFCKILILSPSDPERGRILNKLHEWENEKYYVPAMAQYSFYTIKYKNKIFAEPDNLLNYLSLTEIYKCSGRYQEAENFFRALLKDKPGSIAFKQYLTEVLFLDGKYAEAGTLYRQILDVEPFNIDAMLGLNLILKQRYQSMIEKEPGNMANHIKLARVYRDMKRYEDAISEYDIYLGSDNANSLVLMEKDETQKTLNAIVGVKPRS